MTFCKSTAKITMEVIVLSLLDKKINAIIKNIQLLSWEKSSVYVAPRPYHALAFRLKGDAKFTHGESTVISTQGSITYMPANYSYYAEYPDANEILVIHFDSDAVLELENYTPVSTASILSLFKNAFNVWNDEKQASYYKTMSIFYEILANIAAQADTFYRSNLYDDFIIAVEYMKNNFTDCEFSIEKLAQIANMSNTYFRKIFVERFGETPSKYLTRLRLQHAENLLLSGNYSINEIAFMSGFNDSKYFSRVVKKMYGYPPSQLYR